MCGENRGYFLILFIGLLLSCAVGVLRAEETEPAASMPVAEPIYLISEAELRSIEIYLESSEREKQTWLLQVQELRMRAGNSEAKSAQLEKDLQALNQGLSGQRELYRSLQRSFNEYEAESLTAISRKNGEIAGLEQTVTERTLEAAAYKGSARSRLIVIIALAASWIVFIGFKAGRFFKIF
jgi:hypothetical protein